MAKNKKCPECPKVGAPEYMLTYGDMMTLLVTFFVLLISFSSIEQSKFSMASTSLKGALGVLQGTQGQMLPMTKMPLFSVGRGKTDKLVEEIMKEIRTTAQKSGENEMLKITHDKDTIHFSLSAPMLFTTGSADLKDTAKPLIKLISDVLIFFLLKLELKVILITCQLAHLCFLQTEISFQERCQLPNSLMKTALIAVVFK